MGYLAGLAAIWAVLGLVAQGRRLLAIRPRADLALPKGKESCGVAYALTLGMMPWAKESTRKHLFGYGRGILFHLGVFASLAALVLAPVAGRLPVWFLRLGWILVATGLAAGVLGLVLRLADRSLRVIQHPDDILSLVLVDGLLALALGALYRPAFIPWMYLEATLLFLYLPFSKIRHMMYFFFSRVYFGKLFGRRAVVPHPIMEGR